MGRDALKSTVPTFETAAQTRPCAQPPSAGPPEGEGIACMSALSAKKSIQKTLQAHQACSSPEVLQLRSCCSVSSALRGWCHLRECGAASSSQGLNTGEEL